MKTLGHLSQENTSRYISFIQHRTGPGRQILTEILNSLHKAEYKGVGDDGIGLGDNADEVIARVEKVLNE